MARKAVKKDSDGENSDQKKPIVNGDENGGAVSSIPTEVAASECAQVKSTYNGLPAGTKKGHRVPTVSDIIVDPITQLASEHWSGASKVRILHSAWCRTCHNH
jgi:hypothetical protein